jgi:RimJ/RimL family protein N-acetyltransferase
MTVNGALGGLWLVPLGVEHLPDVRELLQDEAVVRFTGFPWPPVAEFAVTWLARYEAGRLDGTREAFAAVDASGQFLGLALAVHIDAEAAEIELGYVVARAQQGKGVGTELLTALTRWALTDGGAARVTLVISAGNGPSSRIAAKAGYRREGLMRSRYFKQGLRADAELWAAVTGWPHRD